MADGGRLTWFPFSPGDWLADDRVAVMGWKLEGAYLHLLARMWVRGQGGGECSIPDDDAYLGGVLRATPEEVAEIRARLIDGPMAVLQRVGCQLVNKRLLREFEAAKALVKSASDAGKTGAERRWRGGDKPKKGKSKRRLTPSDGHPMPVPLPSDDDAMRAPQRSDGNLHEQEEVPVQEEHAVPVETTYPSDSTVGAPRRADDDDSRTDLKVENGAGASSGDGDDDSPPAPRPKPEPRGCRVPDLLDLDASCGADGATYRSEAVRLGIDPSRVDVLRDEFVDYWRGIPGARGRKTDWPGTWRNRCRDAPARYRLSASLAPGDGRPAQRALTAAGTTMQNVRRLVEEARSESR